MECLCVVDFCLKIVTHMANTRHSKRKCWTCKLCGSWNWWWRKLEWRGPHRGWPEADQSVDFGWKVAMKMEGHGQWALSPVLFCFTPHTHAHCPSIAYWITSNQSIKVTWRRSLHCLNWLTGRWINGCLCSFSWEVKKNKMSEMLLWQSSQTSASTWGSTIVNLHQAP